MNPKTLLLSIALSAWVPTSIATSCSNFFVPVTLTVPYFTLPTTLTAANLTRTNATNAVNIATANFTATYQIGATFCEPTVNNASRRNTLQILQHGIEYNRTYWSALGFTNYPQNNFIEYASNEGYPTLAIDRLCNGNSTHPNGILNCQVFSQAEVLHQLVLKARAGTLPLGSSSRPFNKIITVGHSLGSIIAKVALDFYPNDLDAVILTGFSTRFILGFESLFIYTGPQPGNTVKPQFSLFDASYLTITKESGYDYINYFGDYDPALAHADFLSSQTFTLGEALTAVFAQVTTPNYKGSVFLADGKNDPFYCQTGAATVFDFNNRGDCSMNVPTEVRNSFPNVPDSKYGFHITNNTGHAVNLHRTAPETFGSIFNFLAGQGF